VTRERPILMSAPMVRAILDGRKTQTRRILNEDTLAVTVPRMVVADVPGGPIARRGHHRATMNQNGAVSALLPGRGPLGLKPSEFDFVCPYADGVTRIRSNRSGWEIVPYPGQRLWVKETWAAGACSDGLSPLCLSQSFYRGPRSDNGGLWYAADGAVPAHPVTPKGKTRVSIHMPRWASRLTLEVTGVRVQRLQDISEQDARAEGFEPGAPVPGTVNGKPATISFFDARQWFAALWDAINGDRAPWASNPWLWVVSFRVLVTCPSCGHVPDQTAPPGRTLAAILSCSQCGWGKTP
jgi:predicted RNA-binding Zn-ribbon protein involved in translation (DUF1610 family)